jgi:hypothetical protein
MRRRLIPAVGLSMLIGVGGIGVFGSAVAQAAPSTSSASCHYVAATVAAKSGRLRGCTVATTGGTGVITVDAKKTGDIVTWANGGTTTFKFGKSQVVTPDACPSAYVEEHLTSTVTASTGAAASISGPTSAYLCFPSSGKGEVSLLHGTVWKF